MNSNLTILPSYSDEEHEEYLQKVESELLTNMEVQGKHNGTENIPVFEDQFRTHAINKVVTTIQAAIDYNAQKHQPVSGMVIATKHEKKAKDKIHPIHAELVENEQRKQSLSNEINRLRPDPKKKWFRMFISFCLILLAVSDGWFSFQAFRYGSFPFPSALLAGLGVAVGVGLGAYYLAGYILRATTVDKRRLRHLFVLILYFIVFYIIGTYRANQYNYVSALHIGEHEASAYSVAGVSAFNLAVISISLFALALFISKHFYRTDAELRREQDYEKKRKELDDVLSAIENEISEINKIDAGSESLAGQALARFEYARNCECWLITLAKRAIQVYIEKNMRYRSDRLCPSFFAIPPAISFNTFFDNMKPQKQ